MTLAKFLICPRHFDQLRESRDEDLFSQGEGRTAREPPSMPRCTVSAHASSRIAVRGTRWLQIVDVMLAVEVGRQLTHKDGFNGQVRLARLQAGHSITRADRRWVDLESGARRSRRCSWHGSRSVR